MRSAGTLSAKIFIWATASSSCSLINSGLSCKSLLVLEAGCWHAQATPANTVRRNMERFGKAIIISLLIWSAQKYTFEWRCANVYPTIKIIYTSVNTIRIDDIDAQRVQRFPTVFTVRRCPEPNPLPFVMYCLNDLRKPLFIHRR